MKYIFFGKEKVYFSDFYFIFFLFQYKTFIYNFKG